MNQTRIPETPVRRLFAVFAVALVAPVLTPVAPTGLADICVGVVQFCVSDVGVPGGGDDPCPGIAHTIMVDCGGSDGDPGPGLCTILPQPPPGLCGQPLPGVCQVAPVLCGQPLPPLPGECDVAPVLCGAPKPGVFAPGDTQVSPVPGHQLQHVLAEWTEQGINTLLTAATFYIPFDLTLIMPVAASAPSSAVVTVDYAGTQTVPGLISVEDDPSSSSIEGLVRVEFLDVPNIPGAIYRVSTNGGPATPFYPNGAAPMGSSNCRTVLGVKRGDTAASVYANERAGQVAWVNYTQANFNIDLTYSNTCNTTSVHGVRGGYAADVRGLATFAAGGSYLISTAIAYKGASYYAGGNGEYADLNVRPMFLMGKPEGGFRLEKAEALGYNKESCIEWPQIITDALAFVPWDYAWSVLVHFVTRTYCTSGFKADEWQSGPDGDKDYVGFFVHKDSKTQQYEVGGRVTIHADKPGDWALPLFFYANAYGWAGAAGSTRDASFSRWVGGATGPVVEVI